jgi:hypothetical protein
MRPSDRRFLLWENTMTPNPRDILRSPGRLSYGATSLATAYPHGGTALGIVRAIAAAPNERFVDVIAEEYGGETVERLFMGQSWTISAILRSFDPAALALVAPNSTTGTVSQERIVTEPGTVRAGHPRATAGVKLVFSPDAPDAPYLVLYRAIPSIEASATLQFGRSVETELAIVFTGARDASGRMIAWGRSEDISL